MLAMRLPKQQKAPGKILENMLLKAMSLEATPFPIPSLPYSTKPTCCMSWKRAKKTFFISWALSIPFQLNAPSEQKINE